MQVWLGSGQKPHWPQGAAVTIGNFDGVHQGHRHILQCLRAQADARGLAAVAVVFEPQPQEFFARKAQRPLPYRLSPLRDKLALLADTGCVDAVWVLRFNSALADMNAADFIRQVLLADLNTRYLLVGDDFRFGAQRAGDLPLLQAMARVHGFEVGCMQEQAVQGLRVSSTAVREALQRGDMQAVATLLGRPYAISGHVVHGRKLGRGLQAPTLNLRFAHWKPAASGIFCVQVHGIVADGSPLPGVANMGIRPSLDPGDVNGGRVLLETH